MAVTSIRNSRFGAKPKVYEFSKRWRQTEGELTFNSLLIIK